MEMTFAQRVARAVRESGKSLQAIADEIGTSKGQVSQWQTEAKVQPENVKAHVLEQMSAALNVRPRWLLYGESPMAAGEASQSTRPPDETMAQALELLYLLADARPEDRRFQRPTWLTIQVAAKAIQRAKGSARAAMAFLLEDLTEEV